MRRTIHRAFYTFLIGTAAALGAAVAAAEEPKIRQILPKDRIPAVFDPVFVTAMEAEIAGEAPVIGVAVGDEAHCYSLWLLNGYEIVNDLVGGIPVAATW